jgi:hypothetical protein
LAAIFKTSQSRVRNIRASLGIPPARKHRRAA